MTKSDLKLISSFVDNKNLLENLNYAHLLDDGIYATDTRKAIHFSIPMLGLKLFLHKKILGGFISAMGKDDEATIDGHGYLRLGSGLKMSCDTFPDGALTITDIGNIFDIEFEYKMSLKEIDDIHFELTQRDCFIEDIHLNGIVEYGCCDRYEIFFNKQKVDQDKTNTGKVKVIGLYDTEEERDLVKFTAVIMGREFKTQAQEQLLLDI